MQIGLHLLVEKGSLGERARKLAKALAWYQRLVLDQTSVLSYCSLGAQ